MAVVWLGSGTATISRTETALATGTATPVYTPDVYVSGTATVDRTSVAAWAAQARRTATRVLLGESGEDLVRITGDVMISLDPDSLIATASFTVTDPRCAFFADGSIATGGIPVSIRVRIETDLAETDTAVFRGVTEAAPSTGQYVAVATIQCAGEGAEWLDPQGCLVIPAFAEMSRLDALKAIAESVGIAGSRIRGGESWRTPRLEQVLSGLSPLEVGRRYAEIEDSYLRLVGPDLEIVPAEQIIGPAAVPVFDFVAGAYGTPGNFFSCSETPPNRPPSRLVLSSVGLREEVLTSGTEEITPSIEIETGPGGEVVREVRKLTTSVNGVVIRERTEEWRDIAIPGVTPSAVAWRLWKLVEMETTWGTVTIDGVLLRTARIDSERTVTTEWYSAPCRSTSGYVWADGGGRHIDNAASWQVTEDRITTYTYDAATCLLTSKVANVGGWYSELVTSGHTYDDGSVRADVSYQWTPATAATPYQRLTEDYSETTGDALKVVTSATGTYGWHVPPGATATPPAEEWGFVSGRDDRWSQVPGSTLVMWAWIEYRADGSSLQKSEPAPSGLPALARAAADIPQYRTRALVLEAVGDRTDTTFEPNRDTAWGAESLNPDLLNVARHRLRNARSPRFTIRHRMNPHLKKLDVVTVTDPTWSLVAKKGIVLGFRPVLNVSSKGTLDQDTIVMFPLPEFDPGVALEVA